MLSKILTHWKTSAGGAALIGLAVIEAAGVVIPGLPKIELGYAIMTGIPLLLASDA